MKRNQYLFLVPLLIFSEVFAQKVWTLEECVSHAIDHNLQLNDFDFNTQSNRETYRQSVRNLLPTVAGYADYFIRFGRQEDPDSGNFVNNDIFSNNYSLDASFDLFQGFQKINGIKASKFLYKAAQEESLQQKYLLAFRVMAAYYDIEFIQGLIEISEEQVQISQTNYDLVKKQVELGMMAGADLYEAESLLLTDKLALTQNDNRLKAAKLTLLQAMNLQGESDIAIQPQMAMDGGTESEAGQIPDSVFIKAKGFIPSLKAMDYRVKAAKKQLATTRGGFYPSLTLSGGVGSSYFGAINSTIAITSFLDQFEENRVEYVGATLNLPIFSGWATRSRVKQQKIALERAKNNAKLTEQELYQTVQQLLQENDALVAETAQTSKAVASQQMAFGIAQKRYEKGMINAIQLGQAKNSFATAQNQDLQARLRLRVNKSTLDFYSGFPVWDR